MGKATKRERQKTNKMIKDLERQKIESRAKKIKAVTLLGVILILPLVIIISMLVNSATTPSTYTAKVAVSIEDKEIGTIEIKLDEPNAPKSVKRFIELASNGAYNGLEFYQASKNQAISIGAASADGTGSLANTEQVEGPPRDYQSGDVIWAPDASGATLQVGSSFTFLTAKEKAELFSAEGINQKTEANSGQKASYRFGYIGYITKGLEFAQQIEALAPAQEIDPATGKPKLDESGAEIPAAIKPTKTAKIVRVVIFKDGNEITPGEYTNITTKVTTTTTTTPTS